MFKEPLAAAIVKGEKTATRRLPTENPRAMWRLQEPWRYPVGQVFTVNPGRGVPRVAECEVTARYMATLGEMTVEQGRQEGFPLTAKAGFIAAWQQINGSWSSFDRVHVVEFRLVGPDCMGCDGCGWCEGSPAFRCTDCGGTGVERSAAAAALLERVAASSGG